MNAFSSRLVVEYPRAAIGLLLATFSNSSDSAASCCLLAILRFLVAILNTRSRFGSPHKNFSSTSAPTIASPTSHERALHSTAVDATPLRCCTYSSANSVTLLSLTRALTHSLIAFSPTHSPTCSTHSLSFSQVDYAGFHMPLLYKSDSPFVAGASSIKDSTVWTRTGASLFDVGHMCSLKWTGNDAADFLERVTVADVHGLAVNTSTLSVITNEEGGVIDDTMITKCTDHIYQVID